jgi:hypothetical protein
LYSFVRTDVGSRSISSSISSVLCALDAIVSDNAGDQNRKKDLRL